MHMYIHNVYQIAVAKESENSHEVLSAPSTVHFPEGQSETINTKNLHPTVILEIVGTIMDHRIVCQSKQSLSSSDPRPNPKLLACLTTWMSFFPAYIYIYIYILTLFLASM